MDYLMYTAIAPHLLKLTFDLIGVLYNVVKFWSKTFDLFLGPLVVLYVHEPG